MKTNKEYLLMYLSACIVYLLDFYLGISEMTENWNDFDFRKKSFSAIPLLITIFLIVTGFIFTKISFVKKFGIKLIWAGTAWSLCLILVFFINPIIQIIWFSIAMWFVNEFLKIISPSIIKAIEGFMERYS
jgi:hypothetical protein